MFLRMLYSPCFRPNKKRHTSFEICRFSEKTPFQVQKICGQSRTPVPTIIISKFFYPNFAFCTLHFASIISSASPA